MCTVGVAVTVLGAKLVHRLIGVTFVLAWPAAGSCQGFDRALTGSSSHPADPAPYQPPRALRIVIERHDASHRDNGSVTQSHESVVLLTDVHWASTAAASPRCILVMAY